MGSSRVQSNTVLALDLSDVRKEYAQKIKNLATVRDGSTGELHQGYWLCDVTAAEVNGSEIVPLYQKLFSVEAEDFTSENAEVLIQSPYLPNSPTKQRWAKEVVN